jgi:hypothetical protein
MLGEGIKFLDLFEEQKRGRGNQIDDEYFY